MHTNSRCIGVGVTGFWHLVISKTMQREERGRLGYAVNPITSENEQESEKRLPMMMNRNVCVTWHRPPTQGRYLCQDAAKPADITQVERWHSNSQDVFTGSKEKATAQPFGSHRHHGASNSHIKRNCQPSRQYIFHNLWNDADDSETKNKPPHPRM